jgi:hypothetical protein
MYDLTAPHVLSVLKDHFSNQTRKLDLLLSPGYSVNDRNGTSPAANDVTEENVRSQLAATLGDRFRFAWAAVPHTGRTTGGIFPSAYHLRVAVRDGEALWLSSGNWQSSSIPSRDSVTKGFTNWELYKRYNRDWYVIVESEPLARIFEAVLRHDLEEARQFAVPEPSSPPGDEDDASDEEAMQQTGARRILPVSSAWQKGPGADRPAIHAGPLTFHKRLKVQPLLTPDNYAEKVLELIRGARKSIWLQNQYIHISKIMGKDFEGLVTALRDKQREGLDVRIILRNVGGDLRRMLEPLKSQGFDLRAVRLQPRCSVRGIIIDSQRVLLGSQNWSNDGTTRNRDASLILYDPRIAVYFEQVFAFDWNFLASRRADGY